MESSFKFSANTGQNHRNNFLKSSKRSLKKKKYLITHISIGTVRYKNKNSKFFRRDLNQLLSVIQIDFQSHLRLKINLKVN